MSATGLVTDAMKNVQASAYGAAAPYLTLLKALTLQGGALAAGATSFSVDLSVQVGDVLVFDVGLATMERVTVQSVSGAGPYAVTPTAPTAQAHAASARIGHVPVSAATVHEVTVTRVAANWGAPSPAGVITSAAGAITVPSGNVVGSTAVFSALTAGTYYDATAIPTLDFTNASGAYTPVWVETFS